jgi:hypothetical protein
MKGKVKRDPGAAGKVGQRQAAASTPKPVARTSKAPANAAKVRYKSAAGAARAQNSDLGGASVSNRRAANTADSKVRLMQRNRSTALPKAASDSPRNRQKMREIGRIKRAQANQAQAMKNESAGPNSKMSRKASVAKRAQQIYSGKINPKEKTKARLTKTNNPEALRKRVAKIQDNTKKKTVNKPAAPNTPKPTNAAPKSTARPLSQRETQNLGLAKSNLAISKERLAFAREAKSTAKGPLEKLKATDRINEQQSNIRQINNKITAINARPAPGRPITGADRSGNRKQLSAPKKSGAIKGSIKRDANATAKLNNKSGLNAGKYKNIYMANANKAAAAKRKRKP